MATPRQHDTATLNSASASPRNFLKPATPSAPVSPEAPALVPSVPADERTPAFPPTPVPVARRGWRPLRFLRILRNVPVQTPCWLSIIRVVQLLVAVVVIGCLTWNLAINDFSGYHSVTVVLLVAAAWTVFPTTLMTWPLKGLRHVLDPRLTLFADGLATMLWAMTFASYHSVLWNIETRTKFWATAEGPTSSSRPTATPISTLTIDVIAEVSSIVAEMLPKTSSLASVAIPASVVTGSFGMVDRSPMPHHAVSLDARGTRLGPNGLVSNRDAIVSWKLGLIASYFAAGAFVLFALTTIVFAYYYHSALVVDTAASTVTRSSFTSATTPAVTTHKEKANSADLEANLADMEIEAPAEKSSGGLVPKIAGSLGSLTSPLRKQSQSNDSGVFGVAGKHGVDVKRGGGRRRRRRMRSRSKCFPPME